MPRPRPPAPAPRPDRDRSLPALLRSVLAVIDRYGEGTPRSYVSNGLPEWWEDDNYLYLECILPDDLHREIDIFVNEGKAVIRVAK